MTTVFDDAPAPTRNGSRPAVDRTRAVRGAEPSVDNNQESRQPAGVTVLADLASEEGSVGSPNGVGLSLDEWFLRGWLVFTTAVSMAANIAHALLTVPGNIKILAAVAYTFLPLFVFGSTHIAVTLAKKRRFGIGFFMSITLTTLLAAAAFRLIYSAVSELAVMLGAPPEWAGLWPIVIDISIVNATLAIFVFGRPDRDAKGDKVIPAVPAVAESLSAAQRRFWWERCAIEVRDRNGDVKPITDHSVDEIAEVLQLTHDERETQLAIAESTGLNRRVVRAIQHAGAALLESIESRNS